MTSTRPLPDKSALLEALRERISAELAAIHDSQRAAQEGAVHEETRQEDPKDTRAIEAQYIARGLAERVEELRQTLAALSRVRLDRFGDDTPIGPSALVVLATDTGDRTYFVVPVAGGETLTVGGRAVQTLTPSSPLGSELCGRFVDDDVRLSLGGRDLAGRISRVG